MKFLNPKGRYEPRYEATLDEMFEAIEFTPYSSGVPPRRAGWLFVSESQMNLGYTGGWYHAKFKPELIGMLAPSIFSNAPENLHIELSVQMVKWEEGETRLYMSFQNIIGSYCMATLREEDVIAWLGRAKGAAA